MSVGAGGDVVMMVRRVMMVMMTMVVMRVLRARVMEY